MDQTTNKHNSHATGKNDSVREFRPDQRDSRQTPIHECQPKAKLISPQIVETEMTPDFKVGRERCQKDMSEDIRLRWPEIAEGIGQKAIKGNLRAYLAMREEAWGIPARWAKPEQKYEEIEFENLLPAHDGSSQLQGQNRAEETGQNIDSASDLSTANKCASASQTSDGSQAQTTQVQSTYNQLLERVARPNESRADLTSASVSAAGKNGRCENEAINASHNGHVNNQKQSHLVQSSPKPSSPPIEIDFKQLGDGRLLELIEDPDDPTKTKLAVFDRSQVVLASEVEYEGQVFVPMGRETDGLGDIALPHAPNPYHSTEDILRQTTHLIEACVRLPQPYLIIATTFVMYSWFADRLRPPVYLLVTGLPQSGKTTLLEVLRLLCRRSILVGDITAAAAYDACTRFTPTLLIDENDWLVDQKSRSLRKQLRTGTSSQSLAKHLKKTQRAFGAKILSSQELPDDLALRSRCIHVPMFETDDANLRKPWDSEIVEAANRLQGSFLQLRLEQYQSVASRLVAGAEQLRPRSRDLLGSLLAALPKEDAGDKWMLHFFLTTHDPATRDLLSPAQNAVIIALFAFVHLSPEAGHVRVGRIAELANQSLHAAGEKFKLTPRKVAGLLAALGLSDRTRSSRGSMRGVDQETVSRIHRLVRDHRVAVLELPDLAQQMRGCKLCSELFAISTPRTTTWAEAEAFIREFEHKR